MKNIEIKREVLGPMTALTIYYKGEYVAAVDPETTSNPYDEAKRIAQEFLSDVKNGTAPERYLSL